MECEERRVCIYSQRGLSSHLSRCGGYEFEDLIAGFENTDISTPSPGALSPWLLKARTKLSRSGRVFRLLPSGLSSPKGPGRCHLFFCYVHLIRDLMTLDALGDWREGASCAVCWLQELWVDDLDRVGKGTFDLLNSFDHVICSFAETVPALAERLDVPVTYIPWGVDTLLFSPFPHPPRRTIDFYSVSRTGISDATHRALLAYSRKSSRFYEHQTERGVTEAFDPAEHRWQYAAKLKRAQYFFAHLAKVSRTSERGQQKEFGLRYIEGAAAGTVMLGDRLATPAFKEHLGWADSVIQIPFDCREIGDVIAALESEPDRLEAVRRRNALNAVLRHDHLYRWQAVLQLAGLPETAAMAARRARLAELGEAIEDSADADRVRPVRLQSHGG
jgi:hypothetical protein